MAEFLASTLFNTSSLALRGSAFRTAIAQYANVNMCELTEQVVFTDPFYSSPVNSHTSPQLDDDAAALRCDGAAKAAATSLKRTFMESAQALLHGDLHTGSVMVTEDSTFVIDCEFAFYGPMGFDVGAFIGNLLLAYFASDGCVDEMICCGLLAHASLNTATSVAFAGTRQTTARRSGAGCWPASRSCGPSSPRASSRCGRRRWRRAARARPARRCCSAVARARG
jgi:S-methyl-5-thioribose kinase